LEWSRPVGRSEKGRDAAASRPFLHNALREERFAKAPKPFASALKQCPIFDTNKITGELNNILLFDFHESVDFFQISTSKAWPWLVP
jgi:hypothetical protein